MQMDAILHCLSQRYSPHGVHVVDLNIHSDAVRGQDRVTAGDAPDSAAAGPECSVRARPSTLAGDTVEAVTSSTTDNTPPVVFQPSPEIKPASTSTVPLLTPEEETASAAAAAAIAAAAKEREATVRAMMGPQVGDLTGRAEHRDYIHVSFPDCGCGCWPWPFSNNARTDLSRRSEGRDDSSASSVATAPATSRGIEGRGCGGGAGGCDNVAEFLGTTVDVSWQSDEAIGAGAPDQKGAGESEKYSFPGAEGARQTTGMSTKTSDAVAALALDTNTTLMSKSAKKKAQAGFTGPCQPSSVARAGSELDASRLAAVGIRKGSSNFGSAAISTTVGQSAMPSLVSSGASASGDNSGKAEINSVCLQLSRPVGGEGCHYCGTGGLGGKDVYGEKTWDRRLTDIGHIDCGADQSRLLIEVQQVVIRALHFFYIRTFMMFKSCHLFLRGVCPPLRRSSCCRSQPSQSHALVTLRLLAWAALLEAMAGAMIHHIPGLGERAEVTCTPHSSRP
jgi:hypothetical protein